MIYMVFQENLPLNIPDLERSIMAQYASVSNAAFSPVSQFSDFPNLSCYCISSFHTYISTYKSFLSMFIRYINILY